MKVHHGHNKWGFRLPDAVSRWRDGGGSCSRTPCAYLTFYTRCCVSLPSLTSARCKTAPLRMINTRKTRSLYEPNQTSVRCCGERWRKSCEKLREECRSQPVFTHTGNFAVCCHWCAWENEGTINPCSAILGGNTPLQPRNISSTSSPFRRAPTTSLQSGFYSLN